MSLSLLMAVLNDMEAKQRTQKNKHSLPSPAKDASNKDVVAALRAELQVELQNKRQCTYQPYECTQLTLDGYNYCARHILEDKNAPFRQCSYVYTSNGKRCYLPAPKGDKKDYVYCNEHALKSTLQKNRHSSRYPRPVSAEVLLNSLTHYLKKPKSRTTSTSTQHSEDDRSTPDEGADQKATKSLDPFVDIDAQQLYNASCKEVLDMCSESDSDVEPTTYTNVWHNAQADSSDNESIDSEQEDLLKHANVYTAEEITQVTRDKLIRLQSLYIDQYKHLQHMLRERRRKYLQALKREKENCCSITHQIHDNPKEQRLYKKLKAYNQYHKKHGVDAILGKRVHDLRMKITDGTTPKHHTYSKCAFTEGGVKCGERALPVARHCWKHILEDTNQVLFRPCGKICGDVECSTPVAAIFDDATCNLHMDIPPIRCYNQVRKDSESDYEDVGDMSTKFVQNTSAADHSTSFVKTETINYHLPLTILPKIENIPSLFEDGFEIDQKNVPKMEDSLVDGTFRGSKTDDVIIKQEIKKEEACEEFSAPSECPTEVTPMETEDSPQEENKELAESMKKEETKDLKLEDGNAESK